MFIMLFYFVCGLLVGFFVCMLIGYKNNIRIVTISETILNGLKKHPYFYGLYLISQGCPIDENILQEVSKNYLWAYEYAKTYLERGVLPPPIIEITISRNSHYSFKYAQLLLEKNMPISQIIEEGMSRDGFYLHLFLEELKKYKTFKKKYERNNH